MAQQPDHLAGLPESTVSHSRLSRIKNRLKTFFSPLSKASAIESNGGSLATVIDLLIPLLGMYIGQMLVGAIPKAQVWGYTILGASILLLILRLRPAITGALTGWLQMALGLHIVMPLAVNAERWKAWTPTWQLLAVWAVGCFFVIAAVVRLRSQPIRLGLPRQQPFDRRDWAIVALLIAGALLLRVPYIETIPMGVDPDEASLGLSVIDAATGAATDPFAAGWATHPTLQFFVNSVFIRWLGQTFLALRLPWAIAGSLMVAALYVLARVGYGRRVALLAGLLALGSNTAIHFSRLGLNNNGDSLFVTWVLAALWIAGATGSAWAYAAAGFGLGFAQYFYFGTRAIPFVVLATLIIWLIADWRGTLRAWKLFLGFALVTLVTAGPLLGHWLFNPGSISEHLFLTMPFSDKMQQMATHLNLPEWKLWWYQIRDTLLIFTMTPDRGTFYHPRQAMLHPAQAPLFIIGLLALFARFKRPINQGLIAWILIVLTLGSVLITDAATFHRILGVLPAAILVVAIGVDAGVETLAKAARWKPDVATRLAALVIVALIAMDVHFYFGVYNVHQAYKTPTQEAVTVAALEYQHARGQGSFLLYTHEGVDPNGKIYHSPIAYAAGDTFRGGGQIIENQINTSQPMYFYVLPDMAGEIPRIMARFPGGTLKEYRRSADNLLIMTRYAVVP
jgi:4-amino-4-deoxy-L-arabinose transferase-like glycosyltransferase